MTVMTDVAGDAGRSDSKAITPNVGLPGRLDMRRALDIYVAGRNRTLSPEEKVSQVRGTAEASFASPSTGPQRGVLTGDTASISVPHQLRFDRNAGIWHGRPGVQESGGPSA
jgi:hypothetical protein